MEDVAAGSTESRKSELQDAFMKFRERKLRALKNESFMRQASAVERTPEQMQRLRAKFIEVAKSYYGIPYGKSIISLTVC